MARRDPTRDALSELNRCAEDPRSAASLTAFRRALAKGKAPVAGRAAALAAEHGLLELLAELHRAFFRFLKGAPRLDRQCVAKQAIAEALDRLEHDDVAPFWEGAHHVQLEPGYGAPRDSAGALRGRCVAGLVRLRHPDAYRVLARLLFDPWPDARTGAVRATVYAGGSEGELLLRAKLHAGDDEIGVLGECLSGLMRLSPEAGFELVAETLYTASGEVAELAALALGESRHPRALEALKRAWDEAIGDVEARCMLLLPIALVRSEAAFAFLSDVAQAGGKDLEPAAAEALKTFGRGP
jgi:hypothetical protein